MSLIRRLLFRASARLLSILYSRRDAESLALGMRIIESQLLHDPERNGALFLECARSPQWILRFAAARSIGSWLRVHYDEAFRAILALAQDADARVREGAGLGMAALIEESYDDAQPVVQALLRHPSERARASLALALIPLIRRAAPDERPHAALLDQLLDDPSKLVQSALGNFVLVRTLAVRDRAATIALLRDATARRRRRAALDLAARTLRKVYPADASLMDAIESYERIDPADADFRTTAEIVVPDRVADTVIGQDHAVVLIRRAAIQKRSVLMIGEPGTGKSMLGAALAELLPVEELEDVLAWPNEDDRTTPRVETVPAGEGLRRRDEARRRLRHLDVSVNFVFAAAFVAIAVVALFYFLSRGNVNYLWGALAGFAVLAAARGHVRSRERIAVPKVLINNQGKSKAPFIEATGFHAGGLLGDVRHDPFQSGGVETASHELIEVGAIHQAHKGVLFIDEVATLGIESQQSLLTAFQEKRLAVTGRSPGSSGTMVRSRPIPCDFILALAGNFDDVEKMHPALRSRIRGYGYEIVMNTAMDDTPENRMKLARFIAAEVRKDGRIPHFSRDAVDAIIAEARLRADFAGKLTTRLRELGGLVRAAGDLAVESGAALVEPLHVHRARDVVRPMEEQMRAESSPHGATVARLRG